MHDGHDVRTCEHCGSVIDVAERDDDAFVCQSCEDDRRVRVVRRPRDAPFSVIEIVHWQIDASDDATFAAACRDELGMN